MFVLYLAKKYIVPSLAQKCVEFLEANIAVENVSTVLQQALQFNEKKLEKKCLELIDLKTSKAVASDAFTDINEATLAHILKRESLTVREVDLFKAVLKWSEAECTRKGIEANAKNKRTAMGNVIYQIRFASMTPQDFAQNASQSGILTPEEMVLFYDKFSGVERTSEVWNMSETRAKEDILLRCCRFHSYGIRIWSTTVSTWEDALGISFSKPVKIHGVRLLGDKRWEYNVKLEVWSWIIEKKLNSEQDNRGIFGFDVMLPVPIKVQANVPVHIKATITGRSWAYVEASCVRKTVETNGITVNFETGGKNSRHFDEIIFSEMLK